MAHVDAHLEQLRLEHEARKRRFKVSRVGAILTAIGAFGLVALGLAPAPYVVLQAGPTWDTLGAVSEEADAPPVLEIEGVENADDYSGSLNMLTVSLMNTPDALPGWFQVMAAAFDERRAVLPLEAEFPPGISSEVRSEESGAQMVASQQDSVAAAFSYLDIPFTTRLAIAQVGQDSPAQGILQAGDTIVSINGSAVSDAEQMRARIAESGIGAPADVTFEREGAQQSASIEPYEIQSESGPIPGIGVTLTQTYEFPQSVTITLEDVGGPSAGMMFALGIIDKMSDPDLTGGLDISGTGTIDAAGNVGPIGGIRQKLYGALGNGSTVFLAPAANCDEVVGYVPDGLDVYPVATLDEAMGVLDTLRSGETPSASCEQVLSNQQ